MKPATRILAMLLALSLILPVCGAASAAQKGATLWVVTEETPSGGMLGLIQDLAARFPETASGPVEVRVDVLPTEEDARADYLKDLRAQIAQGGGPDVYLLPTDNALTLDHPKKYTYRRVEPLFPDVDAAMAAGTFLDLKSWYDADKELPAVQETVMAAGVLEDARYVLPLRYNIPVLFAWEDFGDKLPEEVQTSGFGDWMEYLVKTGDKVLACAGERRPSALFGDVTAQTLPTQEDLQTYLALVQKITALIGAEFDHRAAPSLGLYQNGHDPYPVQVATLDTALACQAMAKAEGKQLTILPLPTMAGNILATVKFYGAVGAGCKTPDLAYAFLRQFLTEDAQWEKGREDPDTGLSNGGLIARGWPVAAKGSVAPLWEVCKKTALAEDLTPAGGTARREKLQKITMDDGNLPILETKIDLARFPLPDTVNTVLGKLNDPRTGAATDADLSALAQELLSQLKAVCK